MASGWRTFRNKAIDAGLLATVLRDCEVTRDDLASFLVIRGAAARAAPTGPGGRSTAAPAISVPPPRRSLPPARVQGPRSGTRPLPHRKPPPLGYFAETIRDARDGREGDGKPRSQVTSRGRFFKAGPSRRGEARFGGRTL